MTKKTKAKTKTKAKAKAKVKTVNETKAIELFLKANHYNWDLAYKRPLNILKKYRCLER